MEMKFTAPRTLCATLLLLSAFGSSPVWAQAIETGKATRSENDKTQMRVPLTQTLTPGLYTVEWHVVSVDGHKTKGQYQFSVK